MGGHPFLDHPGPLAFAHRGGALDAPENSMEAFAAAVEIGYRYLETDVHVTADGVLVAFHDSALDRVTDRSGRIADLTWDQVRIARIDGTGTIPRFEDLLEAWPEVRINVDPKADASVAPLISVLREHDALDRVCLGSFSDRRLAEARAALGHGLCTSLGPRNTASIKLASLGLPLRRPAGHCLQVPVRFRGVRVVTERLLSAAHDRAMAVHVWTVDDPDEMHRLLDLGVDGLMTDRPMVLREVLMERGQWGHT
jgi:glycerophosphoryl diester phosphodiesterase